MLATGAVTVVNPGDKAYPEFDPIRLQTVATGGVQPYTWSATGLNPRSSINPSTGLISGLAQAGTWTATVTARDTAGLSRQHHVPHPRRPGMPNLLTKSVALSVI